MVDKVRRLKERAAKLASRGRHAASAELWERVVRLAPADLTARQRLAEVYAKAGQTEAAVQTYQAVAGRYAADGLLLKAIAISKVILQLDPTHSETQSALADLYAKRRGTGPVSLPVAMRGALRPEPPLPPPSDEIEAPRPQHAEAAAPLELGAMGERSGFSDADESDDDEDDDWLVVDDELDDEDEIEFDVSGGELVFDEDALPPIPLFSTLPHDVFVALLVELEMRPFVDGELLMGEGEPGDGLAIIVQGAVEVSRGAAEDRTVLAELAEGAFFGEMALVSSAPRSADVFAVRSGVLFELSKARVERLSATYPAFAELLRRFTVHRLLANLLRTHPLFQGLDTDAQRPLLERFRYRRFAPGRTLLHKGQYGDGLYIVLTGALDVRGGDMEEHLLASLGAGDFFGEMSVLNNAPAAATVQTTAPSIVLRLSRDAFEDLLLTYPEVLDLVSEMSTSRAAQNAELLAHASGDVAAHFFV